MAPMAPTMRSLDADAWACIGAHLNVLDVRSLSGVCSEAHAGVVALTHNADLKKSENTGGGFSRRRFLILGLFEDQRVVPTKTPRPKSKTEANP